MKSKMVGKFLKISGGVRIIKKELSGKNYQQKVTQKMH
jgi:hypothetical protein